MSTKCTLIYKEINRDISIHIYRDIIDDNIYLEYQSFSSGIVEPFKILLTDQDKEDMIREINSSIRSKLCLKI